jgi:hypothetical protein
MENNSNLEKWVKDGSNVMIYNAPPSVVECISFGESAGIIDYCQKSVNEVKEIYWNEEYLAARTARGEIIRFQPELNADIEMFFTRKRNRRDDNTGYVVWDGDYERAKFTKKSLLEWLSRHTEELDEDVRNAIRDMRVSERLDTQNISLGDVERTTEEEEMKTSIPKHFKANTIIAENWYAEMHFKAFVARNTDDYGHVQKGYNIVLELENARQIKRDLMQFVLGKIPESIPKYYGKLKVLRTNGDREL